MSLNWFDRWMIRRVAKKAIMAGGNQNMPVIYTEIRRVAEVEYPMDNTPSINWSLRKWFNAGLEKTAWDILAEKNE